METVVCDCKKREETLIALRRELHKAPEIGGDLPKTRKIVCDYLDKIGVPYTLNPNDDGVVAEIKGGEEGKIIAFRADMDGLHIIENNNLPYKSQIAGQMHGCGHDAHVAMLLIAAEVINEYKEELNGTVRLLFQSGEETGTGAKQMLARGALEGVDAVFALHVGNLAGDEHNAGDLIILPGPVSAGKDKFTITVHGKGTHSAFPEKGIDPILIAARIVNACEEINARELPAGTAAVLSFGSFQAGVDHNTIPDTAILRGSIRVQDDETRDFIGERLKCVATNIAAAFRAHCDVDIKKGSKTIINDADLSEFVAKVAAEAVGENRVITKTPSTLMGSDDFANYASRVPSVYAFLHTNNKEKGIASANHNAGFDIDESVLWEGAATYILVATEYLK
ncbi:MAG: amidohydrolase [Clostridia bacterium]|nr:amidohydrolase [Clostridia bacterium]